MIRLVSRGTARRLSRDLAADRAETRAAFRAPEQIAASEAVWSPVQSVSPTEYRASGRNVRTIGFERHPVVLACTREISNILGAVPLELYTKGATDDEVTVLTKSPALDVLRSPVGMSAGYLRTLTAAHFVVYGNAFWLLRRKGARGAPTGLQLIHPEWIQHVYLDAETLEVAYIDWRDRVGTVHQAPAADLVHFRDLTLRDPIFGFPRAAAALLAIATDSEATEHVRDVLVNDGTPAGVVSVAENISREQAAAAEAHWQEKMASRGGRGRVVFIGGAKTYQQIGFTLEELEFPSLRAISREDICAAFGVDPRMISVASAKGAEGGLSGAQYREARFRLIQQTVMPIARAIEETLDAAFTPEFGYVYARFSPDRFSDLTEDAKETSERTRAELTARAITREEARRRLRLPETPDPMHTLVGTGTGVEYPVAEQFTRTAAPADAQAQADRPDPDGRRDDPEGPARAPEGRAQGGGAPAGATARPDAARGSVAAGVVAGRHPRVVQRGTVLTREQRAELWRLFDTRATAQEAPYERAALVQFEAERSEVARIFEEQAVRADRVERAARAPLTRAGDDPEGEAPTGDPFTDPFIAEAERRIAANYAPGAEYHEAWLRRYRALIGETVQAAGGELSASVGVSFTLENPRVQQVIAERAASLVRHVTETTVTQIRGAIAAGRAAGMGIRQVATLVQTSALGETITRERAVTIARTETVGAINAGEHAAALESGVLRSKEWMSEGDADVRPTHRALDGTTVAIDAPFVTTEGVSLQHPHAPGAPAKEVVKCRCSCLYSDDEPEEAAA